MPKEMYCPHHRYGFASKHTYYKQCEGRMYVRKKKDGKTTWTGKDWWWCKECNKPVEALSYEQME